MRQSEILKARTQLGDLGKDERTTSEATEFLECGLDLSQQLSASHIKKKKKLRRISQLYVWRGRLVVINELKGMWKEAVVS